MDTIKTTNRLLLVLVIPVIFYFNGTHDDYHQPSDTPDKIQYDLLENRTRLIFYTAWEIANREDRLVVDKAN